MLFVELNARRSIPNKFLFAMAGRHRRTRKNKETEINLLFLSR
jgi:hypothetical protein